MAVAGFTARRVLQGRASGHSVAPMRRFLRCGLALLVTGLLTVTLVGPAAAGPFPDVIHLPTGWQAEGIATGPGSTVYSGSLATGAIWKGDLRTGSGGVLVARSAPGRVAVGLKYSRGLLFVAGGPTGQAYVYDAGTGAEVTVRQLTTNPATFVNDVTVTTDAAWFTDSSRAVLYRLPLVGGRPAGDAREVPLGGDWIQVPDAFNANGIDATPSGHTLVVVNSTTGALYTVDPQTGDASRIATDADLTFGDGILLRGRDLTVVRNQLNEVVTLRLSPDLTTATLEATTTDPDFHVPTTAAAFGNTLYVVNAHFDQSGPDVPYEIVKVDGQ